MTTLKTFPDEVTAGANGQQQTTTRAASGLSEMAMATALKILLGGDQDDIRDGLAGVLVFIGTLCHTLEMDMEDLLTYAIALVAEIEEQDAAEKATEDNTIRGVPADEYDEAVREFAEDMGAPADEEEVEVL